MSNNLQAESSTPTSSRTASTSSVSWHLPQQRAEIQPSALKASSSNLQMAQTILQETFVRIFNCQPVTSTLAMTTCSMTDQLRRKARVITSMTVAQTALMAVHCPCLVAQQRIFTRLQPVSMQTVKIKLVMVAHSIITEAPHMQLGRHATMVITALGRQTWDTAQPTGILSAIWGTRVQLTDPSADILQVTSATAPMPK